MCVTTDLEAALGLDLANLVQLQFNSLKGIDGVEAESNATTNVDNGPVSKYSDERRNKSKLAARCRRGRESDLFEDLGGSLPVSNTILKTLDKTSILRLTVCDLNLKKTLGMFGANVGALPKFGSEFETNIGNALNGFVIVMSTNGDIIFVSDDISVYLGLQQSEVMGKSIFDYSHPCDHQDVKELLAIKKGQAHVTRRSGLARVKCTLTSHGNNVTIRAATNKVINFSGKLYLNDLNDQTSNCFIGIGQLIPHPPEKEFNLKNSQVFITTHSADMKFMSVDPSVQKLLGYKPAEMIGKSLFEFQHAVDGLALAPLFKALYAKGQTQTGSYRFLAKNGGYAWVITQATTMNADNKGINPTTIVCRHFVISEIEGNEILSDIQIERNPAIIPVIKIEDSTTQSLLEEFESVLADLEMSKPMPVTNKIFAPKTEDKTLGFLTPCGKELHHEQVDLTHLAPVAGDEAIPLNAKLFEDFLQSLTSADSNSEDNLDKSVAGMEELISLNEKDGSNYIPFDFDSFLEELDQSEKTTASPSEENLGTFFGKQANLSQLDNFNNVAIQRQNGGISDDLDLSLLMDLTKDDFVNSPSAGVASLSMPNNNRKWSMPEVSPISSDPTFANVPSIQRKRKMSFTPPEPPTKIMFKVPEPPPRKQSRMMISRDNNKANISNSPGNEDDVFSQLQEFATYLEQNRENLMVA